MNKLQKTLPVLTVVLMLSLSAMSGCQLFSQPPAAQTNIDQAPQDRRIGVIQSLGGISTSNQGTDLLTMDDGTTILLRSAALNLDDPSYTAKRVEVSGILNYTTDNKQIMDVQNIDILGDEIAATQMQTETPVWQDYVNAGLGFSVKYRSDFQLAENGQTITFTRPVSPDALMVGSSEQTTDSAPTTTQHVISITVKAHGPNETLVKDFLNLTDDSSTTLFAAGYSKSKIGTNGIDAYKEVSKNNVSFSFESGGNFYQVSYQGGDDTQSIEDQNIFYDFLASLQLLNAPFSTQQSLITPLAPTVPVAPAPKVTTPTPIPTPVTSPATTSDSGSAMTITGSTNSSSDSSASSDMNSMTQATTDTGNTNTSDSSAMTTGSPSDTTSSGSPTTGSTVNQTVVLSNPTATISTSPDLSGDTTQQLLPGYSSFVSTGYKFTLEYPKKWYYGQTTSTDSGVVRRYDFGTQPVDQQPGIVNLDIMSGSVTTGTTVTLGNKTVVNTNDGTTSSYYYVGQAGRVYRVSGPASMDATLRDMIQSLQEQ